MAKRLETERGDLVKDGHIVEKKTDHLWDLYINGPKESPFAGGTFILEINLDNYPFKAPVVTFKTQIYHPNVSEKGEVCKDMIETGDKWAPTKRLNKVIEKILNMMQEPNLDTPMNEKAAADYKNKAWEKKAAEDTKKYAK